MNINIKEIRDMIIELSKKQILSIEEQYAKNRCQKLLQECIDHLYSQLRPGNNNP